MVAPKGFNQILLRAPNRLGPGLGGGVGQGELRDVEPEAVLGGSLGKVSDHESGRASNASSGEGSAMGGLSEDADNSESDNESVIVRRPQRNTRGQLPVRYREGYVLK